MQRSDSEDHSSSENDANHEQELFNIFSSLHVLSVNTEKPGGTKKRNMFSLFNSKYQF